MKLLMSLLFIFVSAVSFAGDISCSIENSQKLLSLAAKVIGEMGMDQHKLDKVLLDKKIVDSKEIRQHFMDTKKNSKSGAAAAEVMSFAKAHPECDPEGNFRITHPYK